jgi:phosphopantothenoylcysteine decarboxylase
MKKRKVLHIIVCAAPPASQIHELVTLAQAHGWETCVIATPEATKFIDRDHLTSLTTYPVRSEYKVPGEVDPLPQPDAIAVVPATFNTINKWALGVADTLAVGMLCEHLGREVPIVVVPYLKDDLARHPAFPRSLRMLRGRRIRVLYEPKKYASPSMVPWDKILRALEHPSEHSMRRSATGRSARTTNLGKRATREKQQITLMDNQEG